MAQPGWVDDDEFRPDIEGLRAVAVIAVILFHVRIARFAGGFVGVDVFFVLSGFLITRLLLREVATTGTISLPRFWARRARRLLPASCVVVVATVIASQVLLSPIAQRPLATDAVAAGGFVINFVFAATLTRAEANWARIPTDAHPDIHAYEWLAIAELAVIVLIFWADFHHLIFFSKTPYLLLFGWLSLRVRKLRWRDVGLKLFRNWKSTIGMGIASGLLLEGFQLFISQPILVRALGKQPDLEDFRPLIGNLKLTLIFLALTWTLAAFGEEMVYRGYLMNRIADLLNRTRAAWIISLIAVHVAFGAAHAYQGWTGILDEGLAGLLLGVIYLRNGRNLAVPIIAHGLTDTMDLLLIFLGKYPGM
jgi:membrane protease YdiL (CAAX protease family)